MTLQKELQINIVMSNYYQRSGSYSASHDYLLIDNLNNNSYSNLFRNDLKNLKIKTLNNTECKVLYLSAYSSEPASILVRVPVSKISQTTKLLLEVYDTSTTFSSTLSVGDEVLMFDANSDTFSDFFMTYSGLSLNSDSVDGGKYLRAKYVPSMDGSSPTSLFTTFASGQPLTNNRVTVARFKRISGNVYVNDNGIYHGTSHGCVMGQTDYNLTMYGVDMQITDISLNGNEKDYCMFDGTSTLVQAVSYDEYNSGSDDEGDYIQCHIHGRAGRGSSDSSDYIEGFLRDNPTKLYDQTFHEIEIAPSWYADSTKSDFNYVDLKWLLIYPSPLFAANGIATITVCEIDSKSGIRLFKGSHEYPKAYKGSTLLWDADDENLSDTGLHIPDKIINRDWNWVF